MNKIKIFVYDEIRIKRKCKLKRVTENIFFFFSQNFSEYSQNFSEYLQNIYRIFTKWPVWTIPLSIREISIEEKFIFVIG